MGHYFVGKLLKMKMGEIRIFAFGGITTINEELNSPILKEILMLIAGPLTQILFYSFIVFMYKKGYININVFDKLTIINKTLLSFNLLPILPLDGGKLVNNILDLILPYQMSHTVSIIISFLSLPFLFIIDNKILVTLLFLFLLIKLTEEIKHHKERLTKLILERNFKNYKYKKTKIISNLNEVKRNENYIFTTW